MTGRIPYTKPSITELEVEYATDATRNGWGARCYDYLLRFEALFAEHLGTRFAIATSSCTGALHMGLAALGVGPGDEVIVPDSTWIATVAPVVHLGATPVFVDILADSWCLDPDKVEAALTERTKAIIVVHLYGNLCDMARFAEISEQYGIPVIEDAAEALGSSIGDRRAGTMSRFATFSFHGTKTITTGEGGMFVTDDAALHQDVLTLANHGRRPGQTKQFWPDIVGFKYKMSNVQAAIGCAQLLRISELTARKREILASYRARLADHGSLSTNLEVPGTVNGAWMPTALFSPSSGISSDDAASAFAAADIDARPFFHPLSSLPMFESQPRNRVVWEIPQRAINLPSFHDMSDDEIERVSDVLISLADRRMAGARTKEGMT